MEELISFQNNLLIHVNNDWHRYLYPELIKKRRLLGLKGLRGVGKTTMFLQYLKFDYPEFTKGLYVTADHPYFYSHTLFDLAGEWYRYGGKLLLIDEVHKYPNWSRELKLIYDGHPGLKVIFTSSSALDLYRGESDLSRRLMTQTLHGLSFREYLDFHHGLSFPKYDLVAVLKNHQLIGREVSAQTKILPLFKQYLYEGYFPFSKDVESENLMTHLLQIINTVLESDLTIIEGYDAGHIEKIKKLLGVIAESAPFEPNISKIASRLHLGRNTVNSYLKNLRDARIVQLVYKPGKGISALQKPDKIYFENTSFVYAFQTDVNIGTVRETFFLNQLSNAGHQINLSTDKSDFLIDNQYTFEIGGKNKDKSQIKNVDDSFLALDDIENGFGNKIPLWLIGFLY